MKTQNIILLHGIACTPFVMALLEIHFKYKGYNVLNIDYPSRKLCLEKCADHVHNKISAFLKKHPHPTSFVTHSMGGLVLRAYTKKYPTDFIHRAVMIAPPNKGSHVADNLRNIKLFQKIFGPAGQQLITNQLLYKSNLPKTSLFFIILYLNSITYWHTYHRSESCKLLAIIGKFWLFLMFSVPFLSLFYCIKTL
ncbi:MAG: hypothetical protein CMF61_07445 [Magnetococcales bacterium]|nr:hypothetical protein [Magnetococcales bacterium]|tara:strand:- start:1369 stop:1953 length:585 start_codon:yes stop_codon:yes gene_type:complete